MRITHKKISVSAKNLILQHSWSGNVRELLNTLQCVLILTDGDTIDLEIIQNAILIPPKQHQGNDNIYGNLIEHGVDLEELMMKIAIHFLKFVLDIATKINLNRSITWLRK